MIYSIYVSGLGRGRGMLNAKAKDLVSFGCGQ
jgi:hypothetical protein